MRPVSHAPFKEQTRRHRAYPVNRLPKRDTAAAPSGCCPKFDPKDWDGQTFRFRDKLFMKLATRSFLHIPFNMTSVMKKAMADIDAAGAQASDEYIMLSRDLSPWKSEHFISVDKDVPGAQMVRLSGIYLAKVFEGPFKEAANWYRQLLAYARTRGERPVKIYFSYTTCPRCDNFYGKNYVLGLAQVKRWAL